MKHDNQFDMTCPRLPFRRRCWSADAQPHTRLIHVACPAECLLFDMRWRPDLPEMETCFGPKPAEFWRVVKTGTA